MDIVHENVAKPFTYAVPEGMELIPGQRITVPFGSREKEAVVLSLEQETDIDPSKIRMVTGTLENYAAIPPETPISTVFPFSIILFSPFYMLYNQHGARWRRPYQKTAGQKAGR